MAKTAKERMQDYRNRKRNGTPESVTPALRSNKTTGLTHGSNTIEVDVKTAAKLLLICKACDKEIQGLGGERVNILSLVRYGIGGPTLESIKGQLEG